MKPIVFDAKIPYLPASWIARVFKPGYAAENNFHHLK
jgi:hypothetical protein